jgi:hypothetical protein
MSPARLWHAGLALLTLVGLGIEYQVTIAGHPGQIVSRTVVFWSFFTILTNALVLVISAGFALDRSWALQPSIRVATSVHIVVVAVIFQLLLAALLHLSGLGWWGNMLVHQLVPALWLIGWVAFRPHGGISKTAPLCWLIYPALYGAWVLVYGSITGWYPYPFMDVATHGAAVTARNMTLIGLFFLILGYAVRWIDGRLAQWRAPI